MKNLLFLLSFILTKLSIAQIDVNKEWETVTGNPLRLDWTYSIVNGSDEVITTGNSFITNEGADILTTKINGDGTTAWQRTFNTSSANNDYGINLTEDNSGNIYVVGTTDNNTSTNYDVVVLKYNSSGTLQWSNTFNSDYSKNDIGTAIKVDDDGNVYVAASSEGLNTGYDYLLLKYNSSGNLQWNSRYDYASLIEVPVGLDFNGGNIFIVGASASSASNWDFAIATFNSTGSYLGDDRNSTQGNGFDHPTAFKKDDYGNIYITGSASSDGANYDIKTIKLNSSYAIQWTSLIDLSGNEDVGNSIDVDAFGNVYVGGYCTNSDNKKQMILVKYDASGKELWRHDQTSMNYSGDASVKSIDVTPIGEVYFIGEEKGKNDTRDVIVSKFDTTGYILWQRKVTSTDDEKPIGINVSSDGSVFVYLIVDGSNDRYQVIKYSEFKRNNNVVLDSNNVPRYKANELIVEFMKSAINIAAIDDNIGTKISEFGSIDYYLTSNAILEFNNALSGLCGSYVDSGNPCNITAIKVFKQLKSTDTITLSRLGDTVSIPEFWTTLLLTFPESMDIEQVYTALYTIPNVVNYVEPNFIISLAGSPPNDNDYSLQNSLHMTSGNTSWRDINVEAAWDIIPSGGSNNVRCGVFDSGIKWTHPDFGYNGTDPNTSRVIDGWDFRTGTRTKVTVASDAGGHGTAVAGIIGAIRNNSLNIAGIAGGNVGNSPSNQGVSLYSFRIYSPGFFFSVTIDYVYDAMTNSVLDPILNPKIDYAFRLNISNHSWRYDPILFPQFYNPYNNHLMTKATHFVNRVNVTQVCARGDEGTDNLAIPAIIDDDWILSVGGTGNDGCWDNTMSYGHNVDIGAPSSVDLITTLQSPTGIRTFGGTSGAAPHVSGVVALMMSYLNSSTPNYYNLAPEDCEKIIELSAHNTQGCETVPNNHIGAGLLDAGAAMNLIKTPMNKLYHFGNSSVSTFTISKTPPVSTVTVNLLEDYENYNNKFFPMGTYKVNKYTVDAVATHSLRSNDVIRAFWARPSSSTVLENMNGSDLLPRERVIINSCSNTSCSMTGYVYEVFDMNSSFLGWWPFDINTLSDAKFEYSILAHWPSGINFGKNIFNNISVFPNPSSTQNTIKFYNKANSSITIRLFNSQGKLIKDVFNGKLNGGNNEVLNSIDSLSAGVYFYEIIIDSNIEHIKFVKQ